ncbi:hypothetical protein H4I96_09991 [Botrytis cinerea]
MSSNSNNTPLTAQEARVLELIDSHLRLMHHINTHPRAPLRERGQQATAAAAQPTVWHRGQALNQHQQRLLGLFTQQSETPVAQQPVARRVSYNEIHQRVLLQHQQYLENPAAPQPTYDDPKQKLSINICNRSRTTIPSKQKLAIKLFYNKRDHRTSQPTMILQQKLSFKDLYEEPRSSLNRESSCPASRKYLLSRLIIVFDDPIVSNSFAGFVRFDFLIF